MIFEASTKARSDEAGFTLIEVLVSLAILSLSLAVVLAIFSQGLSRTRDSERAMAARTLGQSILARAENDPTVRMGLITGKMSDGMSWSLDIEPYARPGDDKANLHAATVAVTVTWGNDKSLRLDTLRLVSLASTSR